MLIEILRIYYEIQHPCEDGIINLIQTLNVLTSSSAFAEIPWELNTKVCDHRCIAYFTIRVTILFDACLVVFAQCPSLVLQVWHLFMTALDFSALLKCVNSSEAPPHRLIGSLKKIDAEMQELTKCRNDSVGAVIVAWALFVGVEKRISSTTSAKGSPGGMRRLRATLLRCLQSLVNMCMGGSVLVMLAMMLTIIGLSLVH